MITYSALVAPSLMPIGLPQRFGVTPCTSDRIIFGAKQSATTDYWQSPNVAANWDLNVEGGEDKFRVKFYNDYLRDAVVQPKVGMRIWDAGTGNGTFARSFAENGATVFATDLAPNIAIARKKENPNNRITYQACDINKSPFLLGRPLKRFDKIVCSMVLMDWEGGYKDIEKLYRRFYKALKPNGELIITIKHPIRTRLEAEGITAMYENGDGGLVVKTAHATYLNGQNIKCLGPATYLIEPNNFLIMKHPIYQTQLNDPRSYTKITAAGFQTHHVHRPSYFYTPPTGGFKIKELYGPISPQEAQRNLLDRYLPVIQTIVLQKQEETPMEPRSYYINTQLPEKYQYYSRHGDTITRLNSDNPKWSPSGTSAN